MMDALAAMPKYDVYKDSGVSWLGIVPEKWKVIPAKRRHRVFKSINKRNQCDNVLSLTLRGVVNNNVENPEGLVPRDYASYQVFEKDDLVFKLIDLENFKTSRVGIVHERGIMSPAYIRLSISSNHYPKYAYYYFYDLYLNAVYNNLGEGVRSTLGPTDLLEIAVVEPSFEEQVAIANFLDRKLVQINEAIAIKEKQITLLKERKQIIIQKAVTQGLDPNVPMKDSGVEWIGQVPEHWNVRRAKYLFNEINERSNAGNEELLSVSHMTGVSPRSEKTNVYMFMAEDYTGSKLCRKNDLVMNIMWAWMGALGVSGQTGIVSPSYGVYRQKYKNTFNPIYLEYLLKTTKYIEYYNKVSTGLHSSRLRFYGHMFFAMDIGFPDYDEQNSIVRYLEEQTSRIDQAVAVQDSQIEKLKEYKTTLINNAVTGKIKVA
jgi:type I restriction enzyme S subunit